MLKVVSAYRPFVPETPNHERLGNFDWLDAATMLARSVQRVQGCSTSILTDRHTPMTLPAFRFKSRERRLMLWILDVSLQYLRSKYFDCDTIFISPDTILVGPIDHGFQADLGLLVRFQSKCEKRPILNSVQWWRLEAKARLVAFYEQALVIAKTLPDGIIRWGADSEPLRQLVEPLEAGIHQRSGLSVAMIPANTMLESLSAQNIERLLAGRALVLTRPILDFKYWRKSLMRDCYERIQQAAA